MICLDIMFSLIKHLYELGFVFFAWLNKGDLHVTP